MVEWEDRNKIIEHMEQQDVPLSHCKDCHK